MAETEIRFGIGNILAEGKPATAVVVDDRVATLADIVARYSTPGAAAPAMRDFLPDWDRWHSWLRSLDLKPGLTGPWQVSGRSHIPFEDMLRLDYRYVTNWSFARDLKLIAQTLAVVAHASDPY